MTTEENLDRQAFKHREMVDAQLLAMLPEVRAAILDPAYRERNALIAALLRTNPEWPAWFAEAPDAEGWRIVYAETPAGQVSWHIGPGDFDLFEGSMEWGVVPRPWDGHTTEEKYRRVAALRAKP